MEIPRAPGEPTAEKESVPQSTGVKKTRTRTARPRIDIDHKIEMLRTELKLAGKAMSKARADARAQRKKKNRLTKKAAQLSPEDLERIAILKRCGYTLDTFGDLHQKLVPDVPKSTSASSGLVAPETPAMPADAEPKEPISMNKKVRELPIPTSEEGLGKDEEAFQEDKTETAKEMQK